jgi:hypothetical protein
MLKNVEAPTIETKKRYARREMQRKKEIERERGREP